MMLRKYFDTVLYTCGYILVLMCVCVCVELILLYFLFFGSNNQQIFKKNVCKFCTVKVYNTISIVLYSLFDMHVCWCPCQCLHLF